MCSIPHSGRKARLGKTENRPRWPVLVDTTALENEIVAIGGGARGVNLHLAPSALIGHLDADVVDLTTPEEPAAS